MHSRIFQLSETPIDEADFIEESYYFDHWFTREIADYVNGDTNRDDDINWLKSFANGVEFGCDGDGEFLIVNSKEDYFASSFETFKQCLDKVNQKCNIEDFVKGVGEMWSLKNAHEDRFGFYVDVCYEAGCVGDMMSFDEFVRGANVGIKYYIGNTIDYHF